jgi:plastocyanin
MGGGLRNPDQVLTCALLLLGSTVPGGRVAWAQSHDSAAGRIEGTAVLSRRLTAEHRRVRVYAEPGTRPLPPPSAAHPLANLVIYLEPGPSGGSGEARPAEMRQHGERFVPHVLPILVGSTVDFPNDDPVYHNVFSLSSARSFDLGRYPRGHSKQVTFPKPGVVQVFCHIHADMSAYILVLRNSFFTVPDTAGRFLLDGVPPGEYRLVAWHERTKPIRRTVRVEAGQATELQLDIPIQDVGGAP